MHFIAIFQEDEVICIYVPENSLLEVFCFSPGFMLAIDLL